MGIFASALWFKQIASPARSLSAGENLAYFKSDDKFYGQSAAGTEFLIGPGAGGASVDPQHRRMTVTTGQSIPHNTTTTLVGWTAADNAGSITYANGVFTVPVAGRYYCGVNFGWVEATAGRRTTVILKNGSSVGTADLIPSTVPHTSSASVTVDLAAGDTIAFAAFQNTGSALLLNTDASRNFCSVTLVGGPKGDTGAPGAVVPQRQVFATSGAGQTWTKPANFVYAEVEVCGGGGGGGGSQTAATDQGSCAGGGAGGAYCKKVFLNADLNATETVVVGAKGLGGAANSNGTVGTASSFTAKGVVTLTAAGGGTGQAGPSAASTAVSPGVGGAATGGDINMNGGGGAPGRVVPNTGGAANPIPAFGGGSFFSPPTRPGTATANAAGVDAVAYGGGGSGGYSRTTVAGQVGGDGFAGVVIVTSYVTV